jgi:hypothetical protein
VKPADISGKEGISERKKLMSSKPTVRARVSVTCIEQ